MVGYHIRFKMERKFDLNIKKHVDKLIEMADKKYPCRAWNIGVTFYDDTDYWIQLTSSWGNNKTIFEYTKSEGTYKEK